MLKTCIGDLTVLGDMYHLSRGDSHRIEMTHKALDFCDFLGKKGIHLDYCINHPEAVGCVDYHLYDSFLGSNYFVGKHLLLQERKGDKKKFLVVTSSSKSVDLGSLKEGLGCRKLEFVGVDEMQSLIHTSPGNVSIFNMMADKNREVQIVIDEDLLQASDVAFHPLYNGMSVFMRPDECFKFLSVIDREAIVMPIAEKAKVLYR